MSNPWDKPTQVVAPQGNPWDRPTDTEMPSQPSTSQPNRTPVDHTLDAWHAAVRGNMLGIDPGTAYQNGEEIDRQLRAVDSDYDSGELEDTFANDIKVGLESSIFGLHHREKLPETIRNPGMIDNFVKGLSQMVADSPWMGLGGVGGAVVGGAAGSEVPIVGNITAGAVGAGAGSFALPAAIREGLVEGIKNGHITSFSDLLRRSAHVAWAGAKGAVVGGVSALAGGVPVGGFVGQSAVASLGVKGLYQATAMTTAADLLDGRLPSKGDFASNAALIVPLNLITHGMAMDHGDVEQATMDVYAKEGKTPESTAETLAAQPPVKPDLPEGLRPAIQTGDGFLEGDTTENHAELAERVLAQKPVSIEQLEADPALADDVLQAPQIHEQTVIDRAWQLKKEALEAGESETPAEGEEKPLTIEDLYDRSAMKSGRGFVTPDGKFLSRMEARKWMKDNEPDVHEMWTSVAGDKSAELHSEQYAESRNRVQARSVAEGDPNTSAYPPDLRRFLAENRSGILNKIKAGMASRGYGYEAIRTLLVGPRNMLRAEGEQIVSRLRKLVPDVVEQQALHFYRDYRDDPEQLRSDIADVEAGDNEKLKAFLPAMRRALEPLSPEMAQADQEMTAYFTGALALGKQTGTLNSGVAPSRYSPRMFMRATEEGQSAGGVGRSSFTDRTVNAIRREYLHTLDPLKEGDTEARTFNAIDEMSIYNDRTYSTANAVAIFKNELKNSALGIEGIRNKAPVGWVALTKQFEDRRTFIPEEGEPFTTVRNFYVPKDIADALRPLLEDPGQLSQLTKALHIQSVIKGIELTLSAFHIKALNITAFNNLGLKDFLTSILKDSDAPDVEAIERRGALYGLTTTKTGIPVDAYRGLQPNEAPKGLARLADNAIVNKADDVAKAITDYTFDVVQRKWKVMDFAKKEAGWIGRNPQATEAEYASAMRGYAKEINAAYGGLNWDIMGVSKGIQSVSRLFLLAPDWTFSNVANFKYALLGGGGEAGAASRAFLVKSFTAGFAMTAAASYFIGGKYDPTDIKHIDQVYLGKDKDGKELYANWFFAGAPKDAMNLVKRSYSDGPVAGLAEVMLSKASPVAGTVVDVAKNKDFKGAPIYREKDSDLKKTEKSGVYIGERVLPITGVSALEGVTKALTDPEHEWSYKDVLGLVADLAGSPTYAYGSGQKGSVLPGERRRTSSNRLPGQATRKFSIRRER